MYNNIQQVSNKKIKKFGSFCEVLNHFMRNRAKNQAYIVSKTGKDKKQISEYVRGNTTPYYNTIQEIAESLGFSIEQTEDGQFKYFDPHAGDNPTIEDMIKKYKSEKENGGFSDSERDLLYEVLLKNAESLSANLRRLIEIEKNRSD